MKALKRTSPVVYIPLQWQGTEVLSLVRRTRHARGSEATTTAAPHAYSLCPRASAAELCAKASAPHLQLVLPTYSWCSFQTTRRHLTEKAVPGN